MTEAIEIKIIKNECQCCYNETDEFMNYNCQHLICKKCHQKMKKDNNRNSCLFCDPLNQSNNEIEIQTDNEIEILVNNLRIRTYKIVHSSLCCLHSLIVCCTLLIITLIILRFLLGKND